MTQSVTGVATGVKDKDGDTVTLHYTWSVNGTDVGVDKKTLTPSHYSAGDVIGLKISTVDSFGMSGKSAKAAPANVQWNISAGSGVPGGNVPGVSGQGFGPSETVDIHIDSTSGPVVGTNTTDSSGQFPGKPIPLPSPLPGD